MTKMAVITGAGADVGCALVEEFARDGYECRVPPLPIA